MNRKRTKQMMSLVFVVAFALAFTGCQKKNNETNSDTENTVMFTTENTQAESSSAETPIEHTDTSGPAYSFTEKADESFLASNGLNVYQSSFASIPAIRGYTYVNVGDGIKIYHSGELCGWFAAWDFSDVAERKEGETIGESNIDSYVESKFGNAYARSFERTGKTDISDRIVRYDFAMKILIEKDTVDWLTQNGFYDSEEEALDRMAYPAAISVYLEENSNYGYVLFLESSQLSDQQIQELREAVSLYEDSFEEKQTASASGNSTQQIFSTVEEQFPYVRTYREMCQWFADYNGDKVQRIESNQYTEKSPATCHDIIYYRASQGESLENVVAEMFKAIMEPLKEKSDTRSFTVTDYFLDEQTILLYEDRENTWLLPYLNGYYAYTGTDTVSMETAKQTGKTKDGLVPFVRQGKAESFQFVLMKEGNVYRLQRAEDMGLAVSSGIEK